MSQKFALSKLLITVNPNEVNRCKSKIVKYNRQIKQKYVQDLRYSFDGKEYINLKFEGDMNGITII